MSNNFHSKLFKFIFHPSWSQEETLGKFRAIVKKDPNLFSNNHLKSNQPLRMVKTFAELFAYANNFNFQPMHWPPYFTIALGLMQSYINHQNIDHAVCFKAVWNYTSNKNTYLGQYQLPANNTIYWFDQILPKADFEPKFINSNLLTTPSIIVEENININTTKFNNLDQLSENLKKDYFFDTKSQTFFEFQKELPFLWSPINESLIMAKAYSFYRDFSMSSEEILQIVNYLKKVMSKESSSHLCKMDSKILNLNNQEDVSKKVKKEDLVVFYTPLNLIKLDYKELVGRYPHLI